MWNKVRSNSRVFVEGVILILVAIVIYYFVSKTGDFISSLPLKKIAIYGAVILTAILIIALLWKSFRGRNFEGSWISRPFKWAWGAASGSGFFIGIVAVILFNLLWWSVDESTLFVAMQSRVYWVLMATIIFVALIWGEDNPLAKLSKGVLALGALIVLIVSVSGFIKSHSTSKQSYPTVANGVAHSTTSGGGWRNVTGPQKEYVQRRFGAGSVLDRIAACESGYRQFEDSAGTTVVLRSKDPNSSAMGVFQILGKTHGPKADSLGYDLATVEGNSDFASWLYSNPLPGQVATDPWNESKGCWGDENPSTPTIAVSSPNVSVIGALDTTFVVPDTTLWTPQIPVGGPRYGLTWRANNNDVSLIVRWSKGGVIHQDTMFVGEEQKYLPVIPQWVQVRPLNQEVATIRFVRKSWY